MDLYPRAGVDEMFESTILTVTSDEEFLTLLRYRLRDQVGVGARMIVARTIDEACALLKTARPRLVVVHWNREGGHYDQLDRLLWTTSVLPRRTPTLVIAERYRIEQATLMYRMGVAEYISRTHHLDQVGQIFAAHLRPGSLPAGAVSPSGAGNGRTDSAWEDAEPVTARAV